MKKHQFRNIMILVAFTVVLIFFFIHLSDIWKGVSYVFAVLAPILYGLVIAYILNYPYKVFYNHAFAKMGTKRAWLKRVRKPLALFLSYLIVLGLLVFLVSILIPELTTSITNVTASIPTYIDTVKDWSDNVVAFVKTNTGVNLYEVDTYNQVVTFLTGDTVTKNITNIAASVFPWAWNTAKDIGVALYNWVLGFVISIYLLAGKDNLIRQFKKLIVAYTPEKVYNWLFKVGDVMNNKCGKFIVGKIIDSSIIGVMCFIGLSIFRFHYPLLISFIIGLLNMIPFFGPVIGAVPCTLLLLFINPIEAVEFVIFILVLQWFDGNILGPKILGETVGISGFWIMTSVIAAGGLFGIPGMILGVPMFAAIYNLVSESVEQRLKEKKKKAKIPAAAAIGQETAVPDQDTKS